MLRSYFELRERMLYGRDNNRKSLPFDWGLEHVGVEPNGNASGALHEYVSRSLLDSSTFYSSQPTTNYDLDREILKFPSAIATPYRENNTVWARFFRAGSDRAVVVLPQWNCKWE